MDREDLIAYYDRELSVIRKLGAEFAEKYPKIASRLLLESDRCEDPHVERLIEAFAFLAARVHMKLDDDFPELTGALLSILYPHYLRPIPSMSIVQFHLDPEQGKLSTGLKIPRDSVLYARPVEGYRCRFRTCYDTTIWPVNVVEANWVTPDRLKPPVRAPEAIAALRIVLQCLPDITFDKMEIDSLRFYLSGEAKLQHTLYELLCNSTSQIIVRDANPASKKPPLYLERGDLQPVGFAEDEAMIPYPRRSFTGFRLLQEYFAFPEKFFFLDLKGFDRIAAAGFKDKVEIVILISAFERTDRQQMLEQFVSAGTLRTGCAPIINLFSGVAEGISLTQRRYEYPVEPDSRWRKFMDIFSVDQVTYVSPQTHETIDCEPFYCFRHAAQRDKRTPILWHATRKPTVAGDEELYISLVDPAGRPQHPDADILNVRCTFTNRDLPFRLPFGNEAGDFDLEGVPAITRIVSLRKPSQSLRPPSRKDQLWRLISHLSLNYLSLVEEGKSALQEILRLYNFFSEPRQQLEKEKEIGAITRVSSRRHFAGVQAEHGIHFVRGTQVEIEFDEEPFEGGGVYLFSAVLDRFLGLYTSMNSFTQLVVRTRQRNRELASFPPRAGNSVLI
jgi:type VI secretion system protein ImpG